MTVEFSFATSVILTGDTENPYFRPLMPHIGHLPSVNYILHEIHGKLYPWWLFSVKNY